jgi:hypothetical protein
MAEKEDAGTRAAAIVGMSMSIALVTALKSKGILDAREIEIYLEGVLGGLERFHEPDDAGIQQARKMFEGIAGMIRSA